MEDGSIEEVTERLMLWCVRQGGGLARVEWDSVYARQEVVNRLKDSLSESGISLVEISLPPGQAANETVVRLIEKLRSRSGSVVSITDIEWAFPEGGNRLDTLVALSFKRETLASLPVRQIWWIPSHLTGQLILGVPDLDSWFQLRLHVKEVPLQPAAMEQMDGKTVSVSEARSLARRFWERLEAARAQDFPEERIWVELAQPTVDALQSAGLEVEAETILMRMFGVRDLLERKLQELRTTREGEDDPEVLSLADRLARLLRDRGDFGGAREFQEQVLETRARVLGEEHPETLRSMNNLAGTLRAQGDLMGARRLQERVLEGVTRVRGEEHRDTLAAANNLAVTFKALSDLAGARRLQERVLEVSTRVMGEEHPYTLKSMNNLATTLGAQGDLGGARRLQERVLQMSMRVLGEEHPDTLTPMNNMAAALVDLGDLAGARRLQERVLEVRTRVLGEEHPATLRSMGNLAAILVAQGEFDGSLQILRKCLVGLRKIFGENHPDTVATAEALKQLEERVTSDSR
jgi:tetratricopeptide (TPR) repeat protein